VYKTLGDDTLYHDMWQANRRVHALQEKEGMHGRRPELEESKGVADMYVDLGADILHPDKWRAVQRLLAWQQGEQLVEDFHKHTRWLHGV
jgi:hypothetical protein